MKSETKDKSTHFQGLLLERGLKYTYERKHIFEEVRHLKHHFDADSLYERFKKKGLRIARDTVYRTLPLLLESGVIQKSVGAGKREFYERVGSDGHHDHMVCVRCGKIIEFHCDEIEALQEKMAGDYRAHVRPGSILLFHDGGKNRSKTVKILPQVIREAKAKGLSFLTVSQILE